MQKKYISYNELLSYCKKHIQYEKDLIKHFNKSLDYEYKETKRQCLYENKNFHSGKLEQLETIVKVIKNIPVKEDNDILLLKRKEI